MKRWVLVERLEEVTTSKLVEVEEDQPWQAGVVLEESTRRILVESDHVREEVRKHVVYGRLYRTKSGLYATVEEFLPNDVAVMKIDQRRLVGPPKPTKRFDVHIYTGIAVRHHDEGLSLEDVEGIPR